MALKSKNLESVREDVPIKEVVKGIRNDEEQVRVNINVPESTRLRWKKEALERRMSLGDLITHAVDLYVADDMSK